MLSLRRKNIRVASDYRILGSSKFVHGLLCLSAGRSDVNKCEKETLRLSSKIKSLSFIARSIEEGGGITEWGQIAGPAKCPRLAGYFISWRLRRWVSLEQKLLVFLEVLLLQWYGLPR